MLHAHPPEGIRHFGKHLFATFLGLLMALGLEQWREHRHDRQAAQEALEAVHEEMGRNAAAMEVGIRRCEESRATLLAMRGYVDSLIQAKRKGTAPPPCPNTGPTGTGWLVTADAWSALKSMGLLRNLPQATVRTLSRAYGTGDNLDKVIRLHPSMTQPMAGVWRNLEDPSRLSALDLPKLEAARDDFQDFAGFFNHAGREMALARKAFLEAEAAK